MSFSAEEKELITDLFDFEKTTLKNVQDYLEPHVFDFLQKENNLQTIVDKAIFRPKNAYRPYESIVFTKFLEPNFGGRILKWFKRISKPIVTYYKRKVRDCKYIGVVKNKSEKERYKSGCEGAKKLTSMFFFLNIISSSKLLFLIS